MNSFKLTDLKQQFLALAPKDRLAIALLSVFLAGLIVIYLMLLPAHRFANNAAEQYQQRAEILAWMKSNAAAARTLTVQTTDKPKLAPGQSILSLASQQAQAKGIGFKRFEPFGDGGLRVWLDTVPFNDMLLWLVQLQDEFGIEVQQISIDRDKGNGTVNAKLELYLAG